MSTKTESGVRRDCKRELRGEENGQSGPSIGPKKFRSSDAAEIILALIVLLPTAALILPLVVLVRLTSRGPGIYRQIRTGKGGRQFTMYKIRTMRIDAEARSGPIWTQPSDRRVTLVGRILRKLHLDELPQIFNVIRGEMSFVGPRPERPEFVRILSEAIPGYRDRLAVRPGITGLAQINLPPDTDLMSVRRKLALDLDYIQHRSLQLDARLMLCTTLRVVKIHEGFLTWILRLNRDQLPAAIDQAGDMNPAPAEATPEGILLQAAQDSLATTANEDAASLSPII